MAFLNLTVVFFLLQAARYEQWLGNLYSIPANVLTERIGRFFLPALKNIVFQSMPTQTIIQKIRFILHDNPTAKSRRTWSPSTNTT